jgi:hypothetical protein
MATFVCGPAPASVPDWACALPDEVDLPRLVEPAPVSDPALVGLELLRAKTAGLVDADTDADGW